MTARCGKVLVDLFVAFHPHHDASRERRVRLRCPDGRERWFLSLDDLVIHKLALNRPKDAPDLEWVFKTRGRELDLAYIRRWVRAIAGDGDPRTRRLEELVATGTRSP
jgi:hypothetical protein